MTDPILGPKYDPTSVYLRGHSADDSPAPVVHYGLLAPGSTDSVGYVVSTGNGTSDIRPLWQQFVHTAPANNAIGVASQWEYVAHLPPVDMAGWDAAQLVLEYAWTPTAISPSPLATNFYAMPWDQLADPAATPPSPINYDTFGSEGVTISLRLVGGGTTSQIEAGNIGAFINTPGITDIATDGTVNADYRYTISIRRCYLQPIKYPPDIRPPLRQRQRSDGLAASGAPRHHQHSTLQTSNRQRAVR